jgi:DHA2 family multidrug resistance protein
MLLFAVFTFWGHNILTPNTSAHDFFWPLIMRGIAMGMLFIPVTTLALSTLKGQEIGQGAAFTGMMRQLGGSFGIALITTFLSRQNVTHWSNLASKLDASDPAIQQKFQVMQHAIMSKGLAADAALKASYAGLNGRVLKQAAVLSYMDVFLYLSIMFLICVPFVMMVKGNKKKKVDLGEAMH